MSGLNAVSQSGQSTNLKTSGTKKNQSTDDGFSSLLSGVLNGNQSQKKQAAEQAAQLMTAQKANLPDQNADTAGRDNELVAVTEVVTAQEAMDSAIQSAVQNLAQSDVQNQTSSDLNLTDTAENMEQPVNSILEAFETMVSDGKTVDSEDENGQQIQSGSETGSLKLEYLETGTKVSDLKLAELLKQQNSTADVSETAKVETTNVVDSDESDTEDTASGIAGLELAKMSSQNMAAQETGEKNKTPEITLQSAADQPWKTYAESVTVEAPESADGSVDMKQFLEKLSDTMVEKMNQGVREVEVSVTPESLGKIHMKMELDQGEVRISITCQHEKTLQLLTQHSQDITEIMEKNLVPYVPAQAEHQDYLQQQSQNSNSGQQKEKEQQKHKEHETGDFLQMLRLGMVS